MKFMKLGSKPDAFHSDGDNIRYVATELANDIVVNVGDVQFYLHKFPLLSKSALMQNLVASTTDGDGDEVNIPDIPGGPVAFEICAKFCYGMTVTLNAYNVVAARCAAEYLEMYESVEKGNLVYKIEVFLSSSIFRSWKDSIIVLQTTKSLLSLAKELKLVSRCIDSIATKACIDTSKVDWSYTYNRKKLPCENGNEGYAYGVRKPLSVPNDWWVEDLCDLNIDLYKSVISTLKTKGVSSLIIAEALSSYSLRRLPGFGKGLEHSNDIAAKYKSLAETIIRLLPTERGSVPCGFMLKLLRAAILLNCGDAERSELMRRIGTQLDEATVSDLFIHDDNIVQSLLHEFMKHEQNTVSSLTMENDLNGAAKFRSDGSKMQVAKLIEGYLTEIARDPNLPITKFVNLADMISKFNRPSHDGLYRAIDMYLKEHPGISKSERKRICRLMDCRKLSAEACMHAVQNERLPLRVVVQVLLFEQVRQTTPSAELPGSIGALIPSGSHGSSRSTTTNTDDDWDAVPRGDDIKALRGHLATLRLGNQGVKADTEKAKMKGLLTARIFSKLWSGKERSGEILSSDTSESPASTSRSHSVS